MPKWVECLPNGLGDLGSIPGCVISKTLRMVLDTSLLNTQQYKLHNKGKVVSGKRKGLQQNPYKADLLTLIKKKDGTS